jgi:hypothetical protein
VLERGFNERLKPRLVAGEAAPNDARDARSRPYCGEIGTDLIHIDDDANELPKILGVTDRPLNELSERELCPRSELLVAVNASLR